MATKSKIKKQKVSECCKAPMVGGVYCENCGSNGKFTSNTAIVRKLEKVVSLLEARKYSVKFEVPEKVGERFIDNGDGTISDTKFLPNGKRLMWQKEDSAERMEWKETANYCKNSKVGGYEDWRMPEVEELSSLVDYKRREPAINPMFKCESSGYWSGTKYVSAAFPGVLAWYVNFNNGNVNNNNRYYAYYVRPCRQYF